jgi:hypothetical protein
VRAPVDCEPLGALAPDQAPEAVHADALLLDQLSVEASPDLTVVGLALSVTTAGDPATVTVADWVAEPPTPVQVSSYSEVLVSAPVDQVPLVATLPLQAPEAVHAVASVEDQVSVEPPPCATVVGAAASVTVGEEEMGETGEGEITTTSADWEDEPPAPVQVKVKLLLEVRGSKVTVPLVDLAPLHPPEAMQFCALVALHCSVTDPPIATRVEFGVMDTVGCAVAVESAAAVASPVLETPDRPQAARVENAAHPRATRNIDPALRTNSKVRKNPALPIWPTKFTSDSLRDCGTRYGHRT